MDRRKFIQDVMTWTAGAAVPVFMMDHAALAAETGPAVVGVAEGKEWGELVGRALAPLGGMKAFVKEGARVFIKPNASFDRTPEQGSNTHPDVLKAVIKLCLDCGAKVVTVFDRPLADQRRCYQNSGIGPMVEAIADKRVLLLNDDDRKYTPIKINKGIAFTSWDFFKDSLDRDVYINVPVAKHHNSAKLTIGLKNVLGILGGNRGKIHWSLDQGIADLNTVAKPDLTITDCTRIMLKNGPSGGDLKDVEIKNIVTASADIVANDAWVAKNLFNIAPGDLGQIKFAAAAGLGQMDLAKIKVEKG
jgi:uncharacterized protein (DUF362 family)